MGAGRHKRKGRHRLQELTHWIIHSGIYWYLASYLRRRQLAEISARNTRQIGREGYGRIDPKIATTLIVK